MNEIMPKCPTCNSDKWVEKSTCSRGSHYCANLECFGEYFTPVQVNVSATKPVPLPAEDGPQPPADNHMVESVAATYSKCLDIMRKKSHDYAGLENPYLNFETVQRVGLSVQLGIFIRFLDKVTRLENLLKPDATKPFVTEETVEDTIEDAINYLAILKARRQLEKGNHENSH